MSEKDNGGPAYPVKGGMVFYIPERLKEQAEKEIGKLEQTYDGMTLRDYIAIEAQNTCPINQYEHKAIAEFCYNRADAMLEARKK